MGGFSQYGIAWYLCVTAPAILCFFQTAQVQHNHFHNHNILLICYGNVAIKYNMLCVERVPNAAEVQQPKSERDSLAMKHELLTMSRLAWWCLQAIQKNKGLAQTVRLKLNPDDHRYFHILDDNNLRVYVNGEQTPCNFLVEFNYDTNIAWIQIDDISSLVRPGRMFDFDYLDLDIEPGEFEVEVNFTDALDRIELWKAMPAKVSPDEGPSSPPTVKGGPEL